MGAPATISPLPRRLSSGDTRVASERYRSWNQSVKELLSG